MSRFKYSVGPWNVHSGADAYGPAVRDEIPFEEKVKKFKEIGFDAKMGYYIVLQCENDTELHYGHCEKVLVEAGDRVAVYDKIATLGQTGDATGPCLSFAVYRNGEAVDPMLYFSNIMIKD